MIEIHDTIQKVDISVSENTENIIVNITEIQDDVSLVVSDIGLQGLQGEKGDTGGILYKNSGENINSHTPIVIVNNLAYMLDSSNPLHQFAFVGFTESSSVTGDICIIKQVGEISLNGWGLIPNQHYLASSNGMLITDNLSATNFTKIIGYATDSNTLQIIKDYSTILK